MSLIALIMNGVLAVLLMAALGIGLRLERRLKAVRDSQAQFVKAVRELDSAAAKAQAGLSDLRNASDEALELLGGRIARAKEAADRLDRSLTRTEAFFTPAERKAVQPLAKPENNAKADRLAELISLAREHELRLRPSDVVREPPARANPSIDDDLFIEIERRRA